MEEVRFDSTYEGLKPGLGSGRQLVRTCFDSTYEGVKPTESLIAELRREGFDSTSESSKAWGTRTA